MASSSWPATDSKICIELYVIRYYTFVIRTILQSFSISTLIKAYQSFALAMEIRSHIHVEFFFSVQLLGHDTFGEKEYDPWCIYKNQ